MSLRAWVINMSPFNPLVSKQPVTVLIWPFVSHCSVGKVENKDWKNKRSHQNETIAFSMGLCAVQHVCCWLPNAVSTQLRREWLECKTVSWKKSDCANRCYGFTRASSDRQRQIKLVFFSFFFFSDVVCFPCCRTKTLWHRGSCLTVPDIAKKAPKKLFPQEKIALFIPKYELTKSEDELTETVNKQASPVTSPSTIYNIKNQ